MNFMNVLFDMSLTICLVLREHSIFVMLSDNKITMFIYVMDLPVHHEYLFIRP